MQTSVSGTAYELAYREWQAMSIGRRMPIRAFDMLGIMPHFAVVKLAAIGERTVWLMANSPFERTEPEARARACREAQAQLDRWFLEIMRCKREREAARSIAEIDAADLAAGRLVPAVLR